MAQLYWEKDLKFGIRGSIRPVEDPFEDVFYISDGWGTPFNSLSLRKISILDGTEIASVKLKQPIRTIFFYPDGRRILTASDKRLILLDRETLNVLNKWDKIGCMYPSHMFSDDNFVYLMNYQGPMLTLYRLDNGQITRKKVGSCDGMFIYNDNNILIPSNKEGKLTVYNTEKNQIVKTIDTHLHVECEYSRISNLFAITLGNPYEINQESGNIYSFKTNISDGVIRVYDLNSSNGYIDHKIPFKFDHFKMSKDFKVAFLSYQDSIAIYSFEQSKIIFKASIGGGLSGNWQIVEILPEKKLLIVTIHNEENSKLATFSF